jgi:hypothetical protein
MAVGAVEQVLWGQMLIAVFTPLVLFLMVVLDKYLLSLGLLIIIVVEEEEVAIILDPLRVTGELAVVVVAVVTIMQVQVDLEQLLEDQELKMLQPLMADQVEQILEVAVEVLVEVVVEQLDQVVRV